MVLIPNLFFGVEVLVVMSLLKPAKNICIPLWINETTPFSFNDILHLPPLEGIPRDFKVRQIPLGLFLFYAIFSSK